MIKTILMVGGLATIASPTHAFTTLDVKLTKDDIVDAIIETYGGKQLSSMTSYRVNDVYKGFRRGQSYSPDEIDLIDYESQLFVDLANKKKDFRWVRGNSDGYSIQHQVYDGKQGYRINHKNKAVTKASSMNYVSVERRHAYHLDTAMALLLLESNVDIKRLPDKRVYGKDHYQLEVNAENHNTLYLFIEPDSNKIVKMVRDHWQPGVKFNYHYSAHRVESNILHAKNTYVTRGGEPFMSVSARSFEPNVDLSSAFVIPKGYGQESATIDMSAMSAKKLADNLYMSGQNWGFSVFYDAGAYLIGAGGYEGISERLAAVNEAFKLNKPLKYQVMSHHHIDHLGAVDELVALGTTFVTVADHINTIRQQTQKVIPDDKFMLVEGKAVLAKGAITVLDFPNSHANHNLMTYFSDAKLLFTADTYLSRDVEGAPPGYEELTLLDQLLTDNQLYPLAFAAAHSSRVLSDEDFKSSLNSIKPFEPICPNGWQICPN